MRLPNFLIVGAPKAGTTALYQYIGQHPSVFMSQNKEPHYFSYVHEQWPEWATQSLQEYSELFSHCQSQSALGEASTWYLYSTTAAQAIHDEIPDAKIIAILRQPVDRAYASFVFRQQCGWENLSAFSEAIAQEPERIAKGMPWDYHYLQAGFYGRQLQRYFNVFQKSQIKVILQEDLKFKPQETMRSVFEFLEIDHVDVIDTSQKHNVTKQPQNQTVNNFLARSNPIKTALKRIIPHSYSQKMANAIRAINLKSVERINPELRKRLMPGFRDDILQLQDLIDRDLSHWLHPQD
ncbi:MAG: sulfotransferase [Cyanobacteria bacterium P01_F01_bin.42]